MSSGRTAWYWPSKLEDPDLAARYALIEILAGAEAARLVIPTGWVGVSPLPEPSRGQPEPHALFVADPTDADSAALLVGSVPRAQESAVEVVTRLLASEGLTLVDFAERAVSDFEVVGRSPTHAAIVRAIGRPSTWLLLVASGPVGSFDAHRVALYAAVCSLETFPDWASPIS